MREELEKLVAAGKIGRQHIEPLIQLASAGYCMHRSWGFGRITTVDTIFSRFAIDFPGKPGHSMDLAFAAESLRPISKDHIYARKAENLQAMRDMAALHHLEVIKIVLQSFGGQATIDQVHQVLVPDVIAADWKKWWETARHELKKDGHFLIPSKKNEPIAYQPQMVSLQERLLTGFRSAKGLKARVSHAHEVVKSLGDMEDSKGAVKEMLTLLNADIPNHVRTMPSIALEAMFVRDELRSMVSAEADASELTPQAIWSQDVTISQVVDPMPTTKHKQALLSFKECNPQDWSQKLLDCLNSASTKLCNEATQVLISENCLPQLKELILRLISQHTASSELLLWLAKARSDAFADVLGPEVFRAMLTAIERDQFNEKKSNRLRDFIMDDAKLLVELIESADIEVIKDLTRTLQLSPSFDDMDKRSLLARIVKHFPAIQSLISGEQHARQDTALVVSWESLERRRTEYTELVHKTIPANSREIAIARSYGDLRENHEYKAAKEMQKILMRRKGELENQLGRARGTDFANPATDVVSIGTRVRLTEPGTQHQESYGILGAWDFDADKTIISYLSPMGQQLLNHRVGEEVEIELEGNKRRVKIESIEPCSLPAAAPAPAAQPAASAAAPN